MHNITVFVSGFNIFGIPYIKKIVNNSYFERIHLRVNQNEREAFTFQFIRLHGI